MKTNCIVPLLAAVTGLLKSSLLENSDYDMALNLIVINKLRLSDV